MFNFVCLFFSILPNYQSITLNSLWSIQGVILDGTIKVGRDWAKDVGIYEVCNRAHEIFLKPLVAQNQTCILSCSKFTMGTDGSKVKARYSFIYTLEKGQWKIAHHHSSVMPENIKDPSSQISVDQARNLFHLWNDALDTLDSDLVAKRYSKNAVLLPTVSDEPRTDYEGIKNYFDNFLKLKPQVRYQEYRAHDMSAFTHTKFFVLGNNIGKSCPDW